METQTTKGYVVLLQEIQQFIQDSDCMTTIEDIRKEKNLTVRLDEILEMYRDDAKAKPVLIELMGDFLEILRVKLEVADMTREDILIIMA